MSEISIHVSTLIFFVVASNLLGYVVGHKYAARFILRRVRQLCLAQDQVHLHDLIAILKEEAGCK